MLGRHLLELFFDPALAGKILNRAAVAPITLGYFYLATTPFRTPSHAAYVRFTDLLVTLFRRFPVAATGYQQAAGLPRIECVLDLVAVRPEQAGGVLQLVSLQPAWATMITIYPSGEVDVVSRLWADSADPVGFWQRAAAAAQLAPSPALPASQPPPVPVSEVAIRLGYHPTHIKTLIRRGKLMGAKLGRNWFVDAASLAAYPPRSRTDLRAAGHGCDVTWPGWDERRPGDDGGRLC